MRIIGENEPNSSEESIRTEHPQEDLVCEETIQVRISDLSTILHALSPLPSDLSHAEKKELVWALLRIGRELEQLPDDLGITR